MVKWGKKGRQKISENLAQTQLDSTSRMFYALKGLSGPTLQGGKKDGQGKKVRQSL